MEVQLENCGGSGEPLLPTVQATCPTGVITAGVPFDVGIVAQPRSVDCSIIGGIVQILSGGAVVAASSFTGSPSSIPLTISTAGTYQIRVYVFDDCSDTQSEFSICDVTIVAPYGARASELLLNPAAGLRG